MIFDFRLALPDRPTGCHPELREGSQAQGAREARAISDFLLAIFDFRLALPPTGRRVCHPELREGSQAQGAREAAGDSRFFIDDL
jgi:hypothetical protein